jgi:hypothetical protein
MTKATSHAVMTRTSTISSIAPTSTQTIPPRLSASSGIDCVRRLANPPAGRPKISQISTLSIRPAFPDSLPIHIFCIFVSDAGVTMIKLAASIMMRNLDHRPPSVRLNGYHSGRAYPIDLAACLSPAVCTIRMPCDACHQDLAAGEALQRSGSLASHRLLTSA